MACLILKQFSQKTKTFYLSNKKFEGEFEEEHKTILNLSDLTSCMEKIYLYMKEKKKKEAIIIIENFTSIVYEMQSLEAYQTKMQVLIHLLIKLVQKFDCLILVFQNPKKLK